MCGRQFVSASKCSIPRVMSFTVGRAYELLHAAREHSRLAHAYLITGPEGSGKRDLAVRLIQLVNSGGGAAEEEQGLGLGLDVESEPGSGGSFDANDVPKLETLRSTHVTVVEPESKSRRITVDAIRDAERPLHLAAPDQITKFAVIVDADRMGASAENAFLKTLEEPPRASMLLLLTARPELLLDTILSRCIRISLHAQRSADGVARSMVEDGPGRGLLEALAAHTTEGRAGVSAALGLMAVFSAALKEEKERIGKLHDGAMKEENQHYKQSTEGDWLKRREDYYKALTEAEYQRVRSRYIEYLVAWFGDALRQQHQRPHLDLPEFSAATASLARTLDTMSLMQKASAIDKLRDNLNTNAHEALALENGFIRAFA
jgi:DNA polymerase-3 subunit delta'